MQPDADTCDDLVKRTGNQKVLKGNVAEIEKELATLRNAPKVTYRKIYGFGLQVASSAMDIAHLAPLVGNHCPELP